MDSIEPNTEERIFGVSIFKSGEPAICMVVQCTKRRDVKFWSCGIILPTQVESELYFDFDTPRAFIFYVNGDFVLCDKIAANVANYTNCKVEQVVVIDQEDLTLVPCN